MTDSGLIVNRVAQSAIETLDLAAIVGPLDVCALDLAPMLHRGLVVREKEFRAAVAALDAGVFAGRDVALLVPADALVPAWAVMLVALRVATAAASVAVASVAERRAALAAERIRAYDWSAHTGHPVVVKGCGTGEVPLDAFAQATLALSRHASRVMFGEPCSAVPVWRAAAPRAAAPHAAAPPQRAAPVAAGPPRA